MSSLIKVDESYKKWIEDVSMRFRSSQIKAAVKVNDEMLRFFVQQITITAKTNNCRCRKNKRRNIKTRKYQFCKDATRSNIGLKKLIRLFRVNCCVMIDSVI